MHPFLCRGTRKGLRAQCDTRSEWQEKGQIVKWDCYLDEVCAHVLNTVLFSPNNLMKSNGATLLRGLPWHSNTSKSEPIPTYVSHPIVKTRKGRIPLVGPTALSVCFSLSDSAVA